MYSGVGDDAARQCSEFCACAARYPVEGTCTVGWVVTQPDNTENNEPFSVSHKCSTVDLECETSISRCESERGTHGRGTPPVWDNGQPRLDELFRKLQVKQEREARRAITQLDEKRHNLNNFLTSPLLRDTKASDLEPCNFVKLPSRPTNLRADILHKNSFYYNQETVPKSVTEHCCAWKECRAKFLCSIDLLKHLQDDHLSCLPSNEYQSHRKLTCQWRKCSDSRCYPARYKLLLHLQRCHCSDKRLEQQTGKHQVQEELKAVRIQIGTRREPNQSSYESHDQCIEVTEQLSESIEV